jgi:hypothetical protein
MFTGNLPGNLLPGIVRHYKDTYQGLSYQGLSGITKDYQTLAGNLPGIVRHDDRKHCGGREDVGHEGQWAAH